MRIQVSQRAYTIPVTCPQSVGHIKYAAALHAAAGSGLWRGLRTVWALQFAALHGVLRG
jgi:hypothetical protein